MGELKPCPFCGAEGRKLEDVCLPIGNWVCCCGCKATGPEAETPEEAEALWNQREESNRIRDLERRLAECGEGEVSGEQENA